MSDSESESSSRSQSRSRSNEKKKTKTKEKKKTKSKTEELKKPRKSQAFNLFWKQASEWNKSTGNASKYTMQEYRELFNSLEPSKKEYFEELAVKLHKKALEEYEEALQKIEKEQKTSKVKSKEPQENKTFDMTGLMKVLKSPKKSSEKKEEEEEKKKRPKKKAEVKEEEEEEEEAEDKKKEEKEKKGKKAQPTLKKTKEKEKEKNPLVDLIQNIMQERKHWKLESFSSTEILFQKTPEKEETLEVDQRLLVSFVNKLVEDLDEWSLVATPAKKKKEETIVLRRKE